jgi:hypothetical protein
MGLTTTTPTAGTRPFGRASAAKRKDVGTLGFDVM